MFLILILAVMISVLVPVYNYNVVELITIIQEQLESCSISYEIICLDDASTSKDSQKNHQISNLNQTFFIENKDNLGRTNSRQLLAEKAKFEWLLFLDADVMPKSDAFIANYLTHLSEGYDAIYGGFAYKEEAPESEYMLRWKYGSTHEEISAIERNKKPYKIIISANFMIKRAVFMDLNSKIQAKGYGFDNYFGALLKTNQTKVLHIDNEVYHLGIETSKSYLRKKEAAAETLLSLYRNQQIESHQNDLLHAFIKLKRFGLHVLASMVYVIFGNALRKNLFGNNPSMHLLQLYRISYMCYKDRKMT